MPLFQRIKQRIKASPFGRPLAQCKKFLFLHVWSYLWRGWTYLHQWLWRERRCSFGDKNPDKVFYVIRWDSKLSALMGLLMYVLQKIKYAEGKGWIPIVDFKNGMNCYFKSRREVGTYNAWECFFEQIVPYTLDEVYQSKCVVLGSIAMENDNPVHEKDFYNLGDGYKKWKRVMDQYIRPAEGILDCVRVLNQKFGDTQNAIALKLRGTDMLDPPQGHYYQPTVEAVVEAATEMKKKTGADVYLLSTEDADLASEVANRLGDDVKIINNVISKENDMPQAKSDVVFWGGVYLAELVFLSQCPYLIGGINGGVQGVALFAKDLKAIKTWNLGRAP